MGGADGLRSGAHHPYFTVQNLVPWPLPSAREMGSVVQQCHLEEEDLCGGNSARSSHASGWWVCRQSVVLWDLLMAGGAEEDKTQD